jgi:hypothetical protein
MPKQKTINKMTLPFAGITECTNQNKITSVKKRRYKGSVPKHLLPDGIWVPRQDESLASCRLKTCTSRVKFLSTKKMDEQGRWGCGG